MTEYSEPEVVSEEPAVLMFTAPNGGPKTLEGTHTYLVGHRRAYVIDPGPTDAGYQMHLARTIDQSGTTVIGILLSHGHPDHAPGASELAVLLQVPIWGSPMLDRSYWANAPETLHYRESQHFETDDDVLRVVPSPGHSADHVAFWLEGARILFSGDTILGRGSSLVAPPEGNMTEYMQTLETFASLGARLIAPGHGPLITDPESKLREYVDHRRQRAQQILLALQDGPLTVRGLVSRLYADVDPRLHDLAAGSVEAQLLSFEGEGRVERTEDRYRLVQ